MRTVLKSEAGNIWVKNIMTTARDRKYLCILLENSAKDLGSIMYIEGNNWTGGGGERAFGTMPQEPWHSGKGYIQI